MQVVQHGARGTPTQAVGAAAVDRVLAHQANAEIGKRRSCAFLEYTPVQS